MSHSGATPAGQAVSTDLYGRKKLYPKRQNGRQRPLDLLEVEPLELELEHEFVLHLRPRPSRATSKSFQNQPLWGRTELVVLD